MVLDAARGCAHTVARFAARTIVRIGRARVSGDPLSTSGSDADAALVRRAQAGDSLAFDLLVIKYRRRMERLLLRLSGDGALAEDLAQETFLNAYRALPQFRGEAQFFTWLFRIAVNCARKALGERRRELAVWETRTADDEDETFSSRMEPSTEDTPEALLAAREIAQAVQRAMQALPDDLRQALSLRELDGLSYEEIATVMDCPIGTVRTRIFRAREAVSSKVRPLLQRPGGKRW